MTGIRMQLGALAAIFAVMGYSMPSPATALTSTQGVSSATDFSSLQRGGGGGAQRAGGGNRNVNANRNVNRNTNVNRNVNRNANVNVNRNVNRNVNVNRRANVVVRPVRVWAPRPYYGTIIGGVALGTIIAVSAASVAPVAPAPNMCWYWVDSAQVQGYWDYCTPPY
jgi:hypothetical protein